MFHFRTVLPWLAPWLIPLAGCFQPSSTTSVSSDQQGCSVDCDHSTVGGRPGSGGVAGTSSAASGGGGSSGGAVGTTGGAGSTSNGSSGSVSGSGGSSGGCGESAETICPGLVICPTSTVCSTGTSFASQLVDIGSCSEIASASLAAIDSDGVPVAGAAASSGSDGAFAICLPEGNAFSIQMTAMGYPTTYYAEMLDTDAGYIAQMAALSSETLAALSPIFGFDLTQGLVVAKVTGSICRQQEAGWSFAVTLPDGGPVPDGGYQIAYLSSMELPDMGATATSVGGAALIYNIDTSISDFLAITVTNPDAGSCLPQNTSYGFTGRVFVAGGGSATLDPLLLP